ncbi:GH17383 [Drosophila grimshawi]|uniref:GH17383 n=1 Tax=Drosophila grimshawi TaxID=7222 RepID=B4JV18_DROGR|nr:GH17383 [Drosophila grimshawi]
MEPSSSMATVVWSIAGQGFSKMDAVWRLDAHMALIGLNLEKKPNFVLNNVHNLVVNASITLPTDYRDYEEEEEEEEKEEKTPNPLKCCTVIGPRICRCSTESIRWQCYNKKQQICGNFCSAPKMALKPPTVNTWNDDNNEMLIMPPNFNSGCQQRGNCGQTAERYDCSGCASGQMVSCSPYCYNYRCISPNCAFYDQEQFCSSQQFAGSVGCRREDGWGR